MQTEDISIIFNLPLSEHAMNELLLMQHDIQQVNYDENSIDTWSFLWETISTHQDESTS